MNSTFVTVPPEKRVNIYYFDVGLSNSLSSLIDPVKKIYGLKNLELGTEIAIVNCLVFLLDTLRVKT